MNTINYNKIDSHSITTDNFIESIFEHINPTNKICVELRGGTKQSKSNISSLVINKAWTGLLLEGNKDSYDKEIQNYQERNILNISIINILATCENIVELLTECQVPKEFDLLSIDINGNDYWIWKKIKQFKPRFVVIKYNASFPPPLEWVSSYSHTTVEKTNYAKSSLTSLEILATELGYSLIGINKLDQAFFISNNLLTKTNLKKINSTEAYNMNPKNFTFVSLAHPHKSRLLCTPFDKRKFLLQGDINDQSVINHIDEKGLWEPHISNLFPNVVNKNSICIDIGANIGACTLLLGHLAKKVFSFEPGHLNYYYLINNIIENNLLDKIVPINAALYSTVKKLSYVNTACGGAWSYLLPNEQSTFDICPDYLAPHLYEHSTINNILTLTLDQFIEQRNVPKIDFIKIDTQGSELQILYGSKKILKKWSPELIIEFAPICLKKLQQDDPEKLYVYLTHFYKKLYLINTIHPYQLIPINSYQELLSLTPSWSDLFCTNKLI